MGSSVPNLANNPYAKALEGLHFDDPVKAFFDFCREREAIRLRREAGEPRDNWTKDPVFQQGRFLNVFREDDRVTKALFQFVKPLVGAAKAKPSGTDLGQSVRIEITHNIYWEDIWGDLRAGELRI